MRYLIPTIIQAQYQAGTFKGEFRAASLFVDMSGFTALTEALMAHGKAGAEVLTGVLNDIFNPLVEMVYGHGGFISTFAGDAFTALFPLSEPEAALHAAQTAFFIRQFFALYGVARTQYGDFTLGVKVGLGIGQVEWEIVGKEGRYAYFMRGSAVDSCAGAEHYAERGDIVATPELRAMLESRVEVQPIATHFRLMAHTLDLPTRAPDLPTLTREALSPFVLDAVIDLTAPAEFRNVASVFISFDEPSSVTELNAFVGQVMDEATNYGGYFNKLDFGDKGGVMLLLFGAPVAHENNLSRAADFLLALREQGGDVRWRAGLTFGVVYAGFLGGAERSEYTAIGDVVNLSARLMMGADWGEVWASPLVVEALRSRGYQFALVGEKQFKGKSRAVEVSRLIGKQQLVAESILYTGALIGRETELAQMMAMMAPIFDGRFAGLVYVYGEPGIGKSRLVHELRQRLMVARRLNWFVCPADEILRLSLNPFKHFLRHYFDQSSSETADENKSRFNRALDRLMGELEGSDAGALRAELERTRSVLGALVDLSWPMSLYEQLDPRLRFENMIAAFKTLLLAESRQHPLVLHIEDGHWLDGDSLELLKALARNVESYPLVVLVTGRYGDDGTPFRLPLDPDVTQHTLDLNVLTPEGVRAIAAQVLGGPITDEMGRFLGEKTNGNPFFAEQLTLDMRERDALVRGDDGAWGVAGRDEADMPVSINAVLVARLDRLASQVKAVVQTAAVLGQEFEVRVLSQILRGDEYLSVKVKQAESEAVWSTLTEIRYIFKHALLRDAAYEMQLRARLRELHQLAGGAIEQVYANDLTPHYADLAYHYGRAELLEQERLYAHLAGEQSAARFANAEAARYFGRALELTSESDLTARYELLSAREKVTDIQGLRSQQRVDLEAMAALAERLNDDHLQAEAALRLARYAEATGDYSIMIASAERAITLAQQVGDRAIEAGGLLQWGRALWRQADYPGARSRLEQALSRADRQPGTEADSLRTLGLISMYQGDYSQAQGYYQKALGIHRAMRDRRGESMALVNLGNIAYMQDDFAGARNYYEQALRLQHETGDRWGESMALNNLGGVAFAQGDYAGGRVYCEQALRLNRETGDRQGESNGLCNLGLVAAEQGDYDAARGYFEQALRLSRQVGDRQGESWMLRNLGLLLHSTGSHEAARDYSQQALAIARELNARTRQGDALMVLGHALVELRQPDAAAAAYREGLEIRRELGENNLAMEILAGLARVALTQGDPAGALTSVETILAHLGSGSLDGADEPFRIRLTCYQVLRANQDPRARATLEQAYTLLQERGAQIQDPGLRRLFLENVPAHRDLVAAYQVQ